MKKIKRIHFVGIKGVGLTPLAIIAKEAGISVSGSDVAQTFITDYALEKVGIVPFVGFSPDHVTQDSELVITTGAHGGYSNVEVVRAKELGIPVMTKGEAVGAFMQGTMLGKSLQGIAVAGSHGKTTTTSLLTTILVANKLDPSYVVGTGSFGGRLPGHLGKGKYFIAESDEYATEPNTNKKAQLLWEFPHIALITNIELDHPDIYPSVEDVTAVFHEFAHNIDKDGVIIGCGDDSQVRNVLQKTDRRTISYGFSPQNDYVLSRVHVSGGQTFFRVSAFKTDMGEFRILLTGEHNALNALGATIAALEIGLPLEKIKKALTEFTGSKRRLEFKGYLPSGAAVFDDYAHHPTEIKQTLHALRLRFPKEQLICLFQPHTYSRTKRLFDDFANAFTDSDQVVLTDIFASAREEQDPTVSSNVLAQRLAASVKQVSYLPTLSDVEDFVKKNRFRANTVLVFMGAGDIYTVIDTLSLQSSL
jgi:UDP-N-acetylmuramate--alanine ligase